MLSNFIRKRIISGYVYRCQYFYRRLINIVASFLTVLSTLLNIRAFYFYKKPSTSALTFIMFIYHLDSSVLIDRNETCLNIMPTFSTDIRYVESTRAGYGISLIIGKCRVQLKRSAR